MKKSYPFLLLIFSLALITSCGKDEIPETCSDGIMNQNETEIDCGGICEDCPSIVGIWKTTSFTLDGTDFLTAFEIEDLFYEFQTNSVYSVFVAYQNQANDLTMGNYTLEADSISLIFNSILNKYQYHVTESQLQIEGIDDNGNLIKVSLQRITSDICQGTQCENGDCFFGYCICEQGWIGDNCDGVDLPEKIKITAIEFYGNSITYWNNSFNDYDINPAASNTEAKPDPYLIFRNSAGEEIGRTNTLTNNECTNINPCNYNLDITFNINEPYTIECWNNDMIDGETVDENSYYIIDLDFKKILNEALDMPSDLFGFDDNNFLIALVAEYNNLNDWTYPEITLTNFELMD